MTRRLLASLVAALLVACGSAPGVRTERADQARNASVTEGNATEPATPSTPTSTPTPTPTSTPSAATANGDGLGDALFPALGNPGLDVLHYDIELAFDPRSDTLEGTVGLDVVLTADRDRVTLDAVGLTISQVTVDGDPVDAVADDPELRIPLPQAGRAGDTLRIEVGYRVVTASVDSAIGLPNGWFNTAGGSYVLNEPDGARTWLPCNDHPSDKATFTFTVSVPAGMTAVANGALSDQRTDGDREVWVWQEGRPMATYLIQLLTGDYELVEASGPDGLPLVSAVLRSDLADMQPFLDGVSDMVVYFEEQFGDYPLDGYGLAFADSFGSLAMETQGRSMFSREDFRGGGLDFRGGGLDYGQQLLLAHELAHQWFGDAVSPARWKDIWLNESFATYSHWMWLEHIGLGAVGDEARWALENRPPGSTADPVVQDLFGFNSYDGGAVVVHALRLTIGDDRFFELLQRWVAENSGTSRTTEEFIALAQQVAGEPLTEFFATWLFADVPPSTFPASA